MDYASSILNLLPTGRRSIGVNQLLNKLETYLPPAQVDRIRDAYEFGAEAHEGQKRLSGEPYIAHPVAVAHILADLHMDAPTIVAAILHDVIEDTPTAKDEIAERFGADVAELVDGVSKLDHIQFRSRAEAQAESFRKMLLAMVRDIRVIMVKLADRTHNMRTLGSVPPAKRRTVARETLEIYAPIANRLGIHTVKSELEELGFKALYPGRHRIIEKALKKARGNQKQFVGKIADNVRTALEKAQVKGRVEGREKHLYSIYQKMRRKRAPLTSIVDMFGFRIVVDSIDTCYRALGIVHGLYRPMPGRFKDYIAIPRINGYQSLHTTLFGPNGMPIEVQIRTEDMHRIAESGIAAHWQYKTGEDSSDAGRAYRDRASEWLQHLMEMPHSGNSAEEFMESVKLDLFPDKVYVFTPRGEIRRLPRNATAVDFAYSVHTDIGNHCVAAKVDRRLVPLRTPLRNGQTVEIITAKGATPNPAWVNFVVTAKARAAIRHYLKGLKHGEAVELGKRMLSQALQDVSLVLKKIPEERLQAAAAELNLKTPDELFEKIGLGERLAALVARRLLPADGTHQPEPTTQAEPLAIAGTEGMVVSYARCCFPIPNDPIMAYLSSGRGVVIHREACGNLRNYRKQPDKWLTVTWQPNVDRLFNVEVRIDVANRMGVLAAIASNIATTETNIEHVAVDERDGDASTLIFDLQVRDRKHLAHVIKNLRKMPEVLRVTRVIA
ncbi:bifunctional GTP diphosphokinase/guanosine-3',5'-bis pyrophosphate 3'-pyrophosphohydrolase [Steroidobacter agaridevorans]|uniref:bifunctional GTP diphosphokinase/guanosine-3',5'-bis pyrophosphate 3'-pyrophosphohydrolase n=1 Tax=Steroidobacter agaridevorans TaxID=2695856 RepID=UPI001322F224|nr:bifunctional GTP diphosphokinase/guanosine-3',5'-bis pyrophosphate 3'-pyrophosphohydrolase [Steroidobacter agaridevorans]GFE89671.1 guanosine-3',5'-bis(diphosphate) 3'-pyrophosphohydrolase [Steroidobacter agaridevorans]